MVFPAGASRSIHFSEPSDTLVIEGTELEAALDGGEGAGASVGIGTGVLVGVGVVLGSGDTSVGAGALVRLGRRGVNIGAGVGDFGVGVGVREKGVAEGAIVGVVAWLSNCGIVGLGEATGDGSLGAEHATKSNIMNAPQIIKPTKRFLGGMTGGRMFNLKLI